MGQISMEKPALPGSVLSGNQHPTRELIANQYHLEVVVVSYDTDRMNFSENTNISEVMFIARKKAASSTERVRYISLARNPRSIHEAMDVAGRLIRLTNVTELNNASRTIVEADQVKIAEVVDAPLPSGDAPWLGALFAQFSLFRIVHEFRASHVLEVPGSGGVKLPVCQLSELGELGPDRKRISEGFKPSTTQYSPYKGFFGHSSSQVTTVSQKTNINLVVWNESPRGSDYGPHLWERSGNILLAERIRFNTHRLIAVHFSTNTLGNTWWAFRSALSIEEQKALVLWINSSLGLLEFYSRRVVTQGAFVQMKQPAWQAMCVLDIRQLSAGQLKELAGAYDHVASSSLQPLARVHDDPVRSSIDAALCKTLGLPDMATLRELLSLEPGLGALTEPQEVDDEAEPDDE